MKLTHHDNGTYSLTGITSEELRDMAYAYSSHEDLSAVIANRGKIDFTFSTMLDGTDRKFTKHIADYARTVQRTIADAIRYGEASYLRRRRSIDIPVRGEFEFWPKECAERDDNELAESSQWDALTKDYRD